MKYVYLFLTLFLFAEIANAQLLPGRRARAAMYGCGGGSYAVFVAPQASYGCSGGQFTAPPASYGCSGGQYTPTQASYGCSGGSAQFFSTAPAMYGATPPPSVITIQALPPAPLK